MKKLLLALGSLAVLAFAAGCSHGPYVAKDTTKYTLENSERFVLMDKQVQHSVTSTGIQQRINSDGRLEVVANIKNRENRRIQVQVSCIFKDDQNFSTGDETPWQTLILGENTTEAVNFKSMNTSARNYTIRVRQAR